MQINFEPDWDYMLEKAATFYSREPYIDYNTGYTFKNYYDNNIEVFIGTGDSIKTQYRRQGHMLAHPQHRMGIGNLVATRFEWRWEYQGAKYFPSKANVCIEWNLTKRESYIVDLSKYNRLETIQPEEIWFCVYGTETYNNVIDFWSKTWNTKRTRND